MEKSKVYFADMRVGGSDNLLKKLKRLIVAAGFDTIDFKNKFAAIKIHFGEPGNLSYLRPNYSKVLVDAVAERGGKAFLTDSNTLYVGGRKNALDHLNAAYQNGFNPFVTGCHVLIADGLKGTDEALIPVKNGEYVKEAKIGRAIADADVIISFAHFKMHELTGMAARSKTSAWARARARARWKCIPTASPMWIRPCASAAGPAAATARITPSRSRITRRPSTTTSAPAAAAASASAPSTRSPRARATPMIW